MFKYSHAFLNELALTTTLTYTKNGVTRPFTRSSNGNAAGNGFHENLLALSTTDATLDKGSIVTIGEVLAWNLDATNFIQLGIDGTTYPVYLPPGRDCRFPSNTANWHAKAVAGTPLLFYILIEQ